MSHLSRRQSIQLLESDDEPNTFQQILDTVARTNFEDEKSLADCKDALAKEAELHGILVQWLAQLNPLEFRERKGQALLKLIMQYCQDHQDHWDLQDLFSEDDSYGERTSALHIAIEASNIAFLDCFFDISDETGIDITKALEMVDRFRNNCLHAAISRRLPCATRMATKCSEHALTAGNLNQDTPLHLAMALFRKTRAVTKPKKTRKETRAPSDVLEVGTSGNHRDLQANH